MQASEQNSQPLLEAPRTPAGLRAPELLGGDVLAAAFCERVYAPLCLWYPPTYYHL